MPLNAGTAQYRFKLRCSFTPKIQKQQFGFTVSADKPRNNLGIVKAAFDRLILQLRLYVFFQLLRFGGQQQTRTLDTNTDFARFFAAHGRLY